MDDKTGVYAPVVVRIGIALVFLWFGVSQLLNAADWTSWLPEYALNFPLSAETLVYLNGAFETLLGLMLLFGLGTRIVAILLSIHMAHIISVVGYSEIGIRDFGIFAAVLSVAFAGEDELSLDKKLRSKKEA